MALRLSEGFEGLGVAASSGIWSAVLVSELLLAFDEHGLQVVIRIASFVSSPSISDFEVHDFFRYLVDQPMATAGSSLEPCAHARSRADAAFIGSPWRMYTNSSCFVWDWRRDETAPGSK